MCDPSDIRAIPMVRAPFSQRPTIYLYDNLPGGVGLSFKLYHDPLPTLRGALQLAGQCACEAGCPSCTGPALDTGEGAKQHAIMILKELVSAFSSNARPAE